MKYITCLFLLLIINQVLTAQNWQPIRQGEFYHFRSSLTTDSVSETIFVDSITVVNGDSVFFWNEKTTFCSACSTDSSYLRHQPYFILLQMSKMANNEYVFEDGNRKWHLFPNAGLTSTWVFDSLQNITATVSSVSYSSLFGTNDSLKTQDC